MTAYLRPTFSLCSYSNNVQICQCDDSGESGLGSSTHGNSTDVQSIIASVTSVASKKGNIAVTTNRKMVVIENEDLLITQVMMDLLSLTK